MFQEFHIFHNLKKQVNIIIHIRQMDSWGWENSDLPKFS